MKAVLYILLSTVFIIEWLSASSSLMAGGTSSLGLFPKASAGLIEFFSLVLFITMIDKIVKKNFLLISLLFVVSITTLFVLISILQGVGVINQVLGLRLYLRPLPIFFAGFLIAYDRKNIFNILRFVFIIAILQIPIVIYQFLFITQQAEKGQTSFDLVSGTFGGLSTGTLGLFLLNVSVLVSVAILFRRLKFRYLLLVPLLLMQSVLGDVKIVYIGVVVTIFFFLFSIKLNVLKKISFIVFSLLFLFVFIEGYKAFIGEERSERLTVENQVQNQLLEEQSGRLTRLNAVVEAFKVINKQPLSLVFGVGVGNGIKNLLTGEHGEYYSFDSDRHFANRLILELGLVGVVILILIFYQLYRSSVMVRKRGGGDLDRIVATGFLVILTITFMSLFYNDAFTRAQYAYPFWLIAGIIVKLSADIKLQRKNNNGSKSYGINN
jgi:hypothetical protein